MKASFSSRVLHNWLGVALVLPLFIVGMSTFFMSHEKSLGSIVVAYTDTPLELKDLLYTPDGRQLLATKNGVFERIDQKMKALEGLQNNEIRTLDLLSDGSVLAAGKLGLWKEETNGNWTKLYDADIHGIQIHSQNWYLVTKEQGVLSSKDQGLSWESESNIMQSLTTISEKRPLQLGKLMHDLHTGKFFMGKHYEWIWADSLALVLVILSLTGIYRWWKSQKRKQTI